MGMPMQSGRSQDIPSDPITKDGVLSERRAWDSPAPCPTNALSKEHFRSDHIF